MASSLLHASEGDRVDGFMNARVLPSGCNVKSSYQLFAVDAVMDVIGRPRRKAGSGCVACG